MKKQVLDFLIFVVVLEAEKFFFLPETSRALLILTSVGYFSYKVVKAGIVAKRNQLGVANRNAIFVFCVYVISCPIISKELKDVDFCIGLFFVLFFLYWISFRFSTKIQSNEKTENCVCHLTDAKGEKMEELALPNESEEDRQEGRDISELEKIGGVSRNFMGTATISRVYKRLERGGQTEELQKKDVPILESTKNKIQEKRSPYIDVSSTGFAVSPSDFGLLFLSGIQTYTTKVRRRYKGGNTGFNLRLAKGLYWRIGGNRGVSENFDEDISLGSCVLLITNRYIFIRDANNNVKRFSRNSVVGYKFYTDGVSLNMQNGTPLTFLVSDYDAERIVKAALHEE